MTGKTAPKTKKKRTAAPIAPESKTGKYERLPDRSLFGDGDPTQLVGKRCKVQTIQGELHNPRVEWVAATIKQPPSLPGQPYWIVEWDCECRRRMSVFGFDEIRLTENNLTTAEQHEDASDVIAW